MNRAEFDKTSITTVKAHLERTMLTVQSGPEDLKGVTFVSNHAGATVRQVGDSLNINDIELANRQFVSSDGATFIPALGTRAEAVVGVIGGKGAKGFISSNSGLQGTLVIPRNSSYNFEINSEVDVAFEQGAHRFSCDRQLTIASSAGSISLDGLGIEFDNAEFSFNRRGVRASVAVVGSDNPIRMQSERLSFNIIGLQAPCYETQGDVKIS